MFVYVVATGLVQEGDYIEGIFSSYKLAEKYIIQNKLTTEEYTGARINEYEIDHLSREIKCSV